MVANTSDAGMGPPPEPGRGAWARAARLLWWSLFVSLLLAILGLLAFLWLREPIEIVEDVPGAGPSAEEQALLAEREAENEALAGELAALGSADDLLACPAGMIPDPAAPEDLAPRAGVSPESRDPGTALEDTGPAPGPATARTTVPAALSEGGNTPLPTSELLARLRSATALVLTQNGVGTGFFLAPELLVTNRHVVESSEDGRVLVTNKALGVIHPAVVIAQSPPGSQGAADYALIRVPGAVPASVLPLSSSYDSLTPVIAAGYPGLTVINDAGFAALLSGDATAAPELIVNRGEVQAVQQSFKGLEVIVHSGDLLQGNSGGPLVDRCGRVLGINTYIAVDPEQSGRVSYALSARELGDFLAAQRVPARLDERACGVE
jgi:hypothetical protein